MRTPSTQFAPSSEGLLLGLIALLGGVKLRSRPPSHQAVSDAMDDEGAAGVLRAGKGRNQVVVDQTVGTRHERLAATTDALRELTATLALEVARVEDELAATFDRIARRAVSRADHLQAQAAAARRFAETEREAARHFSAR